MPFESVAIVLNHYIAAAIPGLEGYYLAAAEEIDVRAQIVLAKSASGVLADLPSDIDAVLVALPLHFLEGDIEILVQGSSTNDFPVFPALAPATSKPA